MRLLIITQAVDLKDPILGFFHRWIIEFSRRYDSVLVVALRKGEYVFPKNVRVLSLGKEVGESRLKYLFNFYRFILRERRSYDAVFVHMNPIYVVLGFPIWKSFGKKISLWYIHRKVDLKLRLAELFTDRIYTASKESFKLKSSKVYVTGHGIDLERFPALQDPKKDRKERVVASIGRISPIKDLEFMIRVFTLASKDSNIPMRLELVGSAATEIEKEYKQKLNALIADLGMVQNIFFKGAIRNDDVPNYLRSVDLTLNTSSAGGFDKAVLESLACGVPVLTANEMFKETLSPFGLYKEFGDEEGFAFVLAALLRGVPIDPRELRHIVEKDHSLENLIKKIASDLASGYSKTSKTNG